MLIPRIVTAILLILLVAGLLLLNSPQAWLIFTLVMTVIAGWEWSGFVLNKSMAFRFEYALMIVVLSLLSIQFASTQLLAAMTLMVMLAMVISVSQYQRSQAHIQIKSSILVLGLGGLVLVNFATAFMTFVTAFSPGIVLLSLMTIWALDTGAYFSGRRFGKHKLASIVSPGKTWEGVIGGGVLALLVAGFGLNYLALDLKVTDGIVAVGFMAIAVFSVFGDLFESLMKRQVGLKDSGQLLPGHGGVLDRADSLLVAIPMFHFIWQAVVVIKL